MANLKIIGDTVYDYDHCANYGSDCELCNGKCQSGCMMSCPTTYKR